MKLDSKKNEVSRNGVEFGSLLFLLFLGLKMSGNIDWPWWQVAAPLWVPLALVAALVLAVCIVALVAVAATAALSMISRWFSK